MENVGKCKFRLCLYSSSFKQLLTKTEKELRRLALLPRALMGQDLMMDDYDPEYFEPNIVHCFYGDTGVSKTRMVNVQMTK
jgi:hypothetical protein